jgi:hypothetical protein
LGVIFVTLGGVGIVLWFIWNWVIFNDPLYFVFGPFSARAQQTLLEKAGELTTKGNLALSVETYFYAFFYNAYTLTAIIGMVGSVLFLLDKKIKSSIKVAGLTLLVPLAFNILALYLGHSVLFINGISGNTWFNVRYGVMMIPAVAIFVGYTINRYVNYRPYIIGLILIITSFAFINKDAVTIEDARFGSSQKNVSEVADWLNKNAKNENGYVLISAASHDAVIFSSGLPMKKFIHEGTGDYWDNAIKEPDRWARWIVLRSNDLTDMTWRELNGYYGLGKYELVSSYPFADVYQLKAEYLGNLEYNTEKFLSAK